ncbi:MAG: sigma-54-dependent Fis family transcriptional regulator [Myxococcales bacterium]|nr:sigma-54-dependent Fis family transcriptional regulator [Myxococcales bacterium]
MTTTIDSPRESIVESPRSASSRPVLTLLWSREAPERVGELLLLPARPGARFTIGRASAAKPGADDGPALTLTRLRPFSAVETGPLRSDRISRWQLRCRVEADDSIFVESAGRLPLRVNGHEAARARVDEGDLLELDRQVILRLGRRPSRWPGVPVFGGEFEFGSADAFGLVGESEDAWRLREQIELVATAGEHALIYGPSGSGKELVAHAIHGRSARASAAMIARSASTLPETLLDAELFGNLHNFPNPGMSARPGLVGAAHGSTLFLDEIGELPAASQAHLLRLMDRGEYHRLGEAEVRVSDARIIAATNRPPAQLKHDFLARFAYQLTLSGLDARVDDIPLLARHAFREIARSLPGKSAAFIRVDEPRFSPRLIYALAWRDYTTHARELATLLRRSLATSEGGYLDLPPGELVAAPARPAVPDMLSEPTELTREQVMAAIEQCDGVKAKAWRVLGLRSRYQLRRLLDKFEREDG